MHLKLLKRIFISLRQKMLFTTNVLPLSFCLKITLFLNLLANTQDKGSNILILSTISAYVQLITNQQTTNRCPCLTNPRPNDNEYLYLFHTYHKQKVEGEHNSLNKARCTPHLEDSLSVDFEMKNYLRSLCKLATPQLHTTKHAMRLRMLVDHRARKRKCKCSVPPVEAALAKRLFFIVQKV